MEETLRREEAGPAGDESASRGQLQQAPDWGSAAGGFVRAVTRAQRHVAKAVGRASGAVAKHHRRLMTHGTSSARQLLSRIARQPRGLPPPHPAIQRFLRRPTAPRVPGGKLLRQPGRGALPKKLPTSVPGARTGTGHFKAFNWRRRLPSTPLSGALDQASTLIDAASLAQSGDIGGPAASTTTTATAATPPAAQPPGRRRSPLRPLLRGAARMAYPLASQILVGTALFSSYDALLSRLDAPPSRRVRMAAVQPLAPVLAGLGAGLLSGAASSALSALPSIVRWRGRRLHLAVRRIALAAPQAMALDAAENALVFGAFEGAKRALLHALGQRAQRRWWRDAPAVLGEAPGDASSPQPPPTTTTAATTLPARGTRGSMQQQAPPAAYGAQRHYGRTRSAGGAGASGGGRSCSSDREKADPAAGAARHDSEPELFIARDVVAAVLAAGALSGCVQARHTQHRAVPHSRQAGTCRYC